MHEKHDWKQDMKPLYYHTTTQACDEDVVVIPWATNKTILSRQ